MDFLFNVQTNNRGVLWIEVDLFHATDGYACDEDLAAGLESADIRKSGVHFVAGTTDRCRAGSSLHSEPDDGGKTEENKRADRKFDIGLLHVIKNDLGTETGSEGDAIVAKAPDNAIVRGRELGRGPLKMNPALFE